MKIYLDSAHADHLVRLGVTAVTPETLEASLQLARGLLVRIGQELAPDAPFGGLPLVLIPLGRSLQRHAAGDADYFRFPRVVVAVTGEPRDRPDQPNQTIDPKDPEASAKSRAAFAPEVEALLDAWVRGAGGRRFH